eukprot:6121620-Pleurochrysis_carterae.AAC.1
MHAFFISRLCRRRTEHAIQREGGASCCLCDGEAEVNVGHGDRPANNGQQRSARVKARGSECGDAGGGGGCGVVSGKRRRKWKRCKAGEGGRRCGSDGSIDRSGGSGDTGCGGSGGGGGGGGGSGLTVAKRRGGGAYAMVMTASSSDKMIAESLLNEAFLSLSLAAHQRPSRRRLRDEHSLCEMTKPERISLDLAQRRLSERDVELEQRGRARQRMSREFVDTAATHERETSV